MNVKTQETPPNTVNKVANVVKEIKFEILKIIVLESFLDSIIIFLLAYLGLTLLQVRGIYSFIPSVIFLIIFIVKKIKRFRLKRVEDKHPEIREILRTAADNVFMDNFVVKALNNELIRKMRVVCSSSFIDIRKISTRIAVIISLSFLTLFFASNGYYVFNMGQIIDDLVDDMSNIRIPYVSNESKGDEDIYGDGTIAELGDDAVDVHLNPLNYELDLDRLKDAEEREFKSSFPKEIFATGERSFEDDIPQEEQEIVRDYFDKIKSMD